MSQSLKSWLFDALADAAQEATETTSFPQDLPFTKGNRVQLLKFLTFRPPDDPLAPLDVWAIVGDRTHMIAARFFRGEVTRFQKNNPNLSFTTLRGSLLMLRNVRPIISKISSSVRATPWKSGEYNLAIEVRSFDLLGSIGEPVFWPDARLVTSPKGVLPGEEEKFRCLEAWTRKWTAYRHDRERRRLASKTLKALHREPHPEPDTKNDETVESPDQLLGQQLPTPGQRTRSDTAIHLTPSAERTSRSYSDSRLLVSDGPGNASTATQVVRTSRTRKGSEWDGFDLEATNLPPSEPALPSASVAPTSEILPTSSVPSISDFGPTTVATKSAPSSSASVPTPTRLPPKGTDAGQASRRDPTTPTKPKAPSLEAIPSCTFGDWVDAPIPDPTELGLSTIDFTFEDEDVLARHAVQAGSTRAVERTLQGPTSSQAPSPTTPRSSTDAVEADRSGSNGESRNQSQCSHPNPELEPHGNRVHPVPRTSATKASTTVKASASVRFEGILTPTSSSNISCGSSSSGSMQHAPPVPTPGPSIEEEGPRPTKRRKSNDPASTSTASRPATRKVERARMRKSEAKDKLRMLMASIVD